MFLLDTYVFSEFAKPRPSGKLLDWARGIRESNQYLSVLVLGELLRGAARLPDGERKERLAVWIEGLFESHRDRLVPVDAGVVRTWAMICARAEAAGKPLPAMDSLIAAQCVERGLTLVTRNVEDLQGLGVEILNPWI